ASSASLACTEMRTSPRLPTDTGSTPRGSDSTMVMTPCASRRPRTTRASMSDEVVKITTKSGNGLLHLVDLQQDHRHIVVLRRVADERRNLAQHSFPQLIGRQVRVAFDELAEPLLAEQIVTRVHRFADAVGEEEIQIARVQRNRRFLQEPLEHLAVVELPAEHHPVGHENLGAS